MSVSAHRFARSSLGTSHEIPSGRYDGNAMLLNGSRFHVSCLGNISVKSLTKLCFFKGLVGSKTKSHYEIPREIKPIYRRKKKKTHHNEVEGKESKIPTHHDCFGRVTSAYIHKYVIILVKVDACCILGKNGVHFFWWWRRYIVDLGPYRIDRVFQIFKWWTLKSVRNNNGVRNYKPAVSPSPFSLSPFCEPNEWSVNEK